MRILILANFAMGLYKFRKELINELISKSNEIYISLPNDNNYLLKLQSLGCKYIESNVDRRGTNPFTDTKLILAYYKIIKKLNPHIVLTYTIKPNIYGGIVCRKLKIPFISNITGLGTSMYNKNIVRKIIMNLYKVSLSKSNCVFFQNESNLQYFKQSKIINNNIRLIPGSGVNLEHHRYENYPAQDDKVNILYIGRIMKDKGIEELISTAKKIKQMGLNVKFSIIGFCEEEYQNQLSILNQKNIISYYGQQDDIRLFIKNSHATILPSYHEGKANVLLESAATGRPVLASKIPGCIETFDESISGFGFNVKDVDDMVNVIIRFINLPLEKKMQMGINGRKKMEREYSRQFVVDAYIDEINKLKE